MKKILYLILLIPVFYGCKKPNETSFYFWKTTYRISPFEKDYLQKLNVQKLYVRFFDVDVRNNQAIPVGEINILEKNTLQEIIPVVFMTNETFKDLEKTAIEKLAVNTTKEIQFLYPKISDKNLKEIQFDCDWTATTREKYFYFLRQIKANNQTIILSATIRLHQIKYKNETGFPPADKGVLMYYATDNPLKESTKNSILENNEAKKYIENINQYPIPLDIALPIYSWAIAENELGEKRLINGVRSEDLKDTAIYEQLNSNFYRVKKDYYLKGFYLNEDFKIKTEEILQQDLITAKKNILSKLKNRELTTIFFQLDSSNLTHYSIQDLNSISK